MKKNQQDSELTLMDRFLYKMVIGLSILVLLLIGARAKVINLEKIQNELRQNVNIVKIIEYFNRPNLKLIPIDDEDHQEVINYHNYVNLDGGRRILGVEEAKIVRSGVVVKIIKKDTYSITVKGKDGYEYTYENIETKNVNIYQYVKAGDIIGKVKNNSFDLFVSSQHGLVDADDVLPV